MADDARQASLQFVAEAKTKIALILLGSRIPEYYNNSGSSTSSPSSSLGGAKANKWFQLLIPEIEEVLPQLASQRIQHYVQMHIGFFLVENEKADSERRTLLEHWECTLALPDSSHREDIAINDVLKNFIILIRAVYTYARFMPAYRLLQDKIRNKTAQFKVDYRIQIQPLGFTFDKAPVSHMEFGPIKTAAGPFRVKVTYLQKIVLQPAPKLDLHVVENYIDNRDNLPPSYSPSPSPRSYPGSMPAQTRTPGAFVQSPTFQPLDFGGSSNSYPNSTPINLPAGSRHSIGQSPMSGGSSGSDSFGKSPPTDVSRPSIHRRHRLSDAKISPFRESGVSPSPPKSIGSGGMMTPSSTAIAGPPYTSATPTFGSPTKSTTLPPILARDLIPSKLPNLDYRDEMSVLDTTRDSLVGDDIDQNDQMLVASIKSVGPLETPYPHQSLSDALAKFDSVRSALL